jgi:hypothetical protein
MEGGQGGDGSARQRTDLRAPEHRTRAADGPRRQRRIRSAGGSRRRGRLGDSAGRSLVPHARPAAAGVLPLAERLCEPEGRHAVQIREVRRAGTYDASESKPHERQPTVQLRRIRAIYLNPKCAPGAATSPGRAPFTRSLGRRRPARGRTKVARERRTRRPARASERRKPAPLHGSPHRQTPSSRYGKEGVDGSSPSEGLKYLQIAILCFPSWLRIREGVNLRGQCRRFAGISTRLPRRSRGISTVRGRTRVAPGASRRPSRPLGPRGARGVRRMRERVTCGRRLLWPPATAPFTVAG